MERMISWLGSTVIDVGLGGNTDLQVDGDLVNFRIGPTNMEMIVDFPVEKNSVHAVSLVFIQDKYLPRWKRLICRLLSIELPSEIDTWEFRVCVEGVVKLDNGKYKLDCSVVS